MDRWKLTQHVALQKWSSPSHKMWLWKAVITLCQSTQLSVRKNSWISTRTTSSLQLQNRSFTLNKEEFPPLLSVYSPMGSFTDTAKSSVRVRKSSDKSIFPLVNPIFIILCQVKNRLLGLKYPWNSTRQDQPLRVLKFLVKFM